MAEPIEVICMDQGTIIRWWSGVPDPPWKGTLSGGWRHHFTVILSSIRVAIDNRISPLLLSSICNGCALMQSYVTLNFPP